MTDDKAVIPLLSQIKEWHNLWDLPAGNEQLPDLAGGPTQIPSTTPSASETARVSKVVDIALSDSGMTLALDCRPYLFDNCIERQKRLPLSASQFQTAKLELQNERLVTVFPMGQSHYLVPTDRFYQVFGTKPPKVKRALTRNHSFAILLARHHLDLDPLVQRTELEVPLGTSGSTIDIVTHLKRDGSREAWEVVIGSTGNVAGLAARCQGKGFASLWFLCRDHQVRQVTWAHLQQAGLSPDLREKCKVTLFSSLVKKKKALRKAQTSGEPLCRTSPGRKY